MPRIARLLVLLALLAIGAAAAHAGTPADDLDSLNALRDRNGIPAGVALDASWSALCSEHVLYMRRTNTIEHAEDPTSPWYTDGGNWAAGHAVLAAGITWTPSAFIWESAPLHLAQLLAPQLSVVGIADDDTFVCVTTWPGYLRTPPPTTTVVTYPGPGTSIYASEESAEWPITPAQALGLANPTGPHLYVYQWGPGAIGGATADGQTIAIRSATLNGPDGPEAVRWADGTNPTVGPYLPAASGIVIPARPLALESTYTATVAFTNDIAYAWSFSTATIAAAATLKDVRIVPRRVARRRSCVLRRAGRCTRWRTRFEHTVAITGRFAGTAEPRVAIASADAGVDLRRAQAGRVMTAADGTFRVTCRFSTGARRFRLRVTIGAGSGVSEYLVRFRVVNRSPSGAIGLVYGISPAPYAPPQAARAFGTAPPRP